MIPNITINDQTLQQMTDQMLQPIDEALSRVMHENANPCIIAAQNFLTSIRKGYEDLITANLIAKHQNKIKKAMKKPQNNVISLKDQYDRNQAILKEMYLHSQVVEINKKMQLFSEELNNFLGQEIQLMYVYTDSKGKDPIVLSIDDIGKLMKKGMGSKGSGIKTRIDMKRKEMQKYLKDVNSGIKRLAEEDYMTTKQIHNLKQSYNQVINRFNQHGYKVKSGKNKQKIVHVILWHPPKLDWKIVIMGNNRGDIKQAYAAALISHKKWEFLSKNKEKNIDDLMNYVSRIDSIPGILQGDFSVRLKNGKTLQYAIKSAGSSSMSLKLAVELAVEILNAQPPFDKKALQSKKKEYSKNIKPRNKQKTLSILQELFENNLPDEIVATIGSN